MYSPSAYKKTNNRNNSQSQYSQQQLQSQKSFQSQQQEYVSGSGQGSRVSRSQNSQKRGYLLISKKNKNNQGQQESLNYDRSALFKKKNKVQQVQNINGQMNTTVKANSYQNIFNNSFYHEKQVMVLKNNKGLNKNSSFLYQQQQPSQFSSSNPQTSNFSSLQFLNKYFASNHLQPIISRALKKILNPKNNYLPENPYNLMYRIMMNDVLTNNIKKWQANGERQGWGVKIGKGIGNWNIGNNDKKNGNNLKDTRQKNKNILNNRQSKQSIQSGQGSKQTISAKEKNSQLSSDSRIAQEQQQQILTKRIQIHDTITQFYIGNKISKFVNSNTLYYLWFQVYSKQRLERIGTNLKKYQNTLKAWFNSLGGSLVYDLEGGKGQGAIDSQGLNKNDQQVIKLGLKVKQKEGLRLLNYTKDSMLDLGYYIIAQQKIQESQILPDFSAFIIDEILQQMQTNFQFSKQNNMNNPLISGKISMHLIKLSIISYQKQMITEWSCDQLIQDKIRVIKQIVKSMLNATLKTKQNYNKFGYDLQIKAKYYMKLNNKKISYLIDQEYIIVNKTYILIRTPDNRSKSNISGGSNRQRPSNESLQSNNSNKNSKQSIAQIKSSSSSSIYFYNPFPLTYMFQHFFSQPLYYEYLDTIYNLNDIQNSQIYRRYLIQSYNYKLIKQLKINNLKNFLWDIMFFTIYDQKLKRDSVRQSKGQKILDAVNLVLNNPLNFLLKIIHQLKVCKLLLNPNVSFNFTSGGGNLNTQNQIYQIIQQIETKIYIYQKKGDFIYPQIQPYLQAARKFTAIILLKKRLKVNLAKLILDHLILMLKSLIGSFETILFSIQGKKQFIDGQQKQKGGGKVIMDYLKEVQFQFKFKNERESILSNQNRGSKDNTNNNALAALLSLTQSLNKNNQGQSLFYNPIHSFITFQNYLIQIKQLPARTLNIQQTINYYKKQPNFMSEPQPILAELIMAKYIKQYHLYEIVYSFYFDKLICGKKVNYPLSLILSQIKNRGMEVDFRLIRKQNQKLNSKKNINENKNNFIVNRINGVQIFELNDNLNKDYVFYSLSQNTLNASAFQQYQKVHQKFGKYFGRDKQSQKQMTNSYQRINNSNSNSTIQSNMKKYYYILSSKSLPFLNSFSEQIGGVYVHKFYAECVIKVPLKKTQLYNFIYNEIIKIMSDMYDQQIGVIGLYSSWKNLSNSSLIYHGDDDQVISWDSGQGINSIDMIKFDYKKKITFQKMYKFLEHCLQYKKQVQIRCVYKDGKVIQACNLVINFYYPNSQNRVSLGNIYNNVPNLSSNPQDEQNKYTLFVPINTNYQDRVFYSKNQIIEWNSINNILKIISQKMDEQKKQNERINSITSLQMNKNKNRNSKNIQNNINGNIQSPIKQPIKSSQHLKMDPPQVYYGSLKKIYMQEQVLLEQIIVQDQDQIKQITSNKAYKIRVTLQTIRELSPYYSKLQQSYHQLINLIYLIQFMKFDRRSTFCSIEYFSSQIRLLEYYLIHSCIKHDKFIYLEGLGCEILNLIQLIKQYQKRHSDNYGQERQLIYLQKIILRISSIVKMLMYSCSLAVAWGVRSIGKQQEKIRDK